MSRYVHIARLCATTTDDAATVLDSSIGKPAAGVPVQLQELRSTEDPTAGFNVLADGLVLTVVADDDKALICDSRVTDYDGRCMQLYPEAGPGQKREDLIKLQAGKLYKVVFKTKDYFESVGRKCFYPWVEVRRLVLH